MESLDELTSVVESSLEEYNQTHKNAMNLVIFRYVLEHLSRICRIIKQPGGNGLLVGVGGSGRQSLTRLATAMADYHLFQPEITKAYSSVEWKDDLKVFVLCVCAMCASLMCEMCSCVMCAVCNVCLV